MIVGYAEWEIVNAGNCMICGKPIKIVPVRGNCRFTNIFFCSECKKELKNVRINCLPVEEKEDET